MAEAQLLLTVEQAAERLALGRTSVYGLLNRGELKVVRIGRSVRVLARDVEAYAERLAETATAR